MRYGKYRDKGESLIFLLRLPRVEVEVELDSEVKSEVESEVGIGMQGKGR